MRPPLRRSVPLPAELVQAAAEYADGTRAPAEPRNAATVVLLREPPNESGAQVYLLRRQRTMAFAAGMYVFPGGGVDERDFAEEVADHWEGPSPRAWAAQLGTDEPLARALVCAAVRELFEEAGVLLAGASGSAIVPDTTGADWEADRAGLEARELALTDLLRRRDLRLRTDLLRPWSGWLTPVFEPRRYRTWFFVAALPAGQQTRDVSTESDQVTWLGVDAAVAAVEAREVAMMPPTYLTCLELASAGSVQAALAEGNGRRVEMFTPTVEGEGEQARLSVPPGAAELLARRAAAGG